MLMLCLVFLSGSRRCTVLGCLGDRGFNPLRSLVGLRPNPAGRHQAMMDDDGNLAFASFRGSPPDLAGPTFPRAGDLIVAELCSWGCDKAMEVLKHERLMDEQNRTEP